MTNHSGVAAIIILPSVTGFALLLFLFYHLYLVRLGVSTNESIKKTNTENRLANQIHDAEKALKETEKEDKNEENREKIKNLTEKIKKLRENLEIVKKYHVKQSLFNILRGKI